VKRTKKINASNHKSFPVVTAANPNFRTLKYIKKTYSNLRVWMEKGLSWMNLVFLIPTNLQFCEKEIIRKQHLNQKHAWN
jgi:hypothetical protein